ncbi:MAG TPA: hypothetical protein VL136_06015 [Candidatus Babeliales bacterium]|jgi:hypothetical protein|nr:hypothetical protein [Candidatus Babeliales bacterium]
MKQFKLSSKRKSSGQVVVLLIIVLALLGGAWWYMNSNKQNSEKEGKDFANEVFQKIAVQHDINYFNSRLSPQARMNFPASAQQEFMGDIARLGAPVRPVDVQGKIEFQSQFFEPHGSFQARIYYPAKYADMNISVSHPVGRWQIDEIAFLPQRDQPGMPAPAVAPQTAPAQEAPSAAPGAPPPQAPPASTGGPEAPPASTGAPGSGG